MGDSQSNHNQFHHQNLLSFAQPHQHHPFLQQQQPPQPRVRGGGSSGVGEIVAVQGGHIVRSTGRKDRHSKVCTARGPRDRRVRLSAHTAIQFYDVQDRLGYDRPSKAVDWLIKNAKEAIDKLTELPAWQPSSIDTNANTLLASANDSAENSDEGMPIGQPTFGFGSSSSGGAGDNGGAGGSTSFLPPSMDSDTIADTIKSFFPMAGAASTPTSFQSYTPDLLSRTGSQQSQELRLSLQSFQQQQQQPPPQQQEPMFHHHSHTSNVSAQQTMFSSAANMGGASSSMWADQGQEMVAWNASETGGGNAGNYMFSISPAAAALQHPSQFFIQRGPLQSNNQPSSMRGWQPEPVASECDHPMQHHGLYPAISSIGFASAASGFGGFRIPARIQGEEEHDGGMANKPHSASSASHHHS